MVFDRKKKAARCWCEDEAAVAAVRMLQGDSMQAGGRNVSGSQGEYVEGLEGRHNLGEGCIQVNTRVEDPAVVAHSQHLPP